MATPSRLQLITQRTNTAAGMTVSAFQHLILFNHANSRTNTPWRKPGRSAQVWHGIHCEFHLPRRRVRGRLEEELGAIISKPESFLGDPLREAFARDLYAPAYKQRDQIAPWHQWGVGLDASAVQQLANACALPVAVAGALMPDVDQATACRLVACWRRRIV